MSIAGYGMATLGSFVGKELGVSGWLRVEQERIDEFARATGDHQPTSSNRSPARCVASSPAGHEAAAVPTHRRASKRRQSS